MARDREAAIIQNVLIAVVDNDALTRDFIVNVMTYCVNREVRGFEKAEDLMTFLGQGHTLHLLLVNLSLPDQGGFSLLKTMKEIHPQTYLIALSAAASDQDRAEALGADVFLAKPLVLRDLFKIVQDYVVGDQGLQPAPMPKNKETPENPILQ